MKGKSCLISITAFAVAAINSTGQQPGIARPNILYITTDYQSGQDVPWESPVLRMPNLGQMAKSGIVFNKHYCTAPISMPSRYTMISGMYPHFHQEWDNQSIWLPEGTPTMMELLRASGYLTAGIGKMHFSPWNREAGFDKWISAERKGNSAADTVRQDDYAKFLKKAGLTRADYLNLQNSGEVYGVYDWPFADSLHIDSYVGNQASGFISQNKSAPWFLWVSFNGPHNPWDPPARFTELYKDEPIEPAVWKEGELSTQPYDYTLLRYNYTRTVVDQIDEQPENRDNIIRKIRAAHYGGLTFIDDQLGKILKSLRTSGQLDNTIIIFTADHGSALGDHDLIHKGTHYDRSARVPMVIWYGANIKSGRKNTYTSHVDIMPTVLDYAAVSIPKKLEGKSLRPVISGAEDASDHAVIEIRNNYSWICDKYIFGIFPETRQEVLIDRIKDPSELKNVIADADYKSVGDSLRLLLYAFNPAIIREFEQGKELGHLPDTLNLKGGVRSSQELTPYLGGKAFDLEINFTAAFPLKAQLASFWVANLHGLSINIDGNTFVFGFRRFGTDKQFRLTGLPIIGENRIILGIRVNGMAEVTLNDKLIGSFRTDWPMAVQPGSENSQTGIWLAGKDFPPGIKPIGEKTLMMKPLSDSQVRLHLSVR